MVEDEESTSQLGGLLLQVAGGKVTERYFTPSGFFFSLEALQSLSDTFTKFNVAIILSHPYSLRLLVTNIQQDNLKNVYFFCINLLSSPRN